MFNLFDVAVVALVAACGFVGFRAGVVASVFYLASGFVGMWAAGTWANGASSHFLLVFLAAAAAVIVTGLLLRKLCRALLLGLPDRLGGLALGLLLATAFLSGVIWPGASSKKAPAVVRESALASVAGTKVLPAVRKTCPWLTVLTPERVRTALPAVRVPVSPDEKETPARETIERAKRKK